MTILRRAACGLWLMCGLVACGGAGPSEQQLQTLGTFIDAIDANYTEHNAKVSRGEMELGTVPMLISMESRELELIDQYLATEQVPDSIRVHLQSWHDGLELLLPLHRGWSKAGHKTPADGPADEQSKASALLMQTTSAESQLRILAGR